jgi:3-deoxy-D-manno-octulosonic-acid transferase
VSVGEVLSAIALIRRMREERPQLAVFVSTTTLAGRAVAEEKLAGLADGVFYAPLDYRSIIRRVLRQLRPALVVIAETEIWPNLYREVKRSGASLVVVNGRISDRALPRYIRWRAFFRHVLCWPDQIQVQSEEDARRYVLAGAPTDRVRVAGNLKYDFQLRRAMAPEISRFFEATAPSAVWIAASTMPPLDAESPGDPDEDTLVIEVFRELALKHPGLLLILAPRKPERFGLAAEKLQRSGVRFVRRTALRGGTSLQLPGVLLLDSIGELAAVFERADVVFMGGTLARRGGHNILEPAFFGKPVITGPHMENFAEMEAEFTAAGALVKIGAAGELAGTVSALLDDPLRAAGTGSRARDLAASKRGVAEGAACDLLRAAGQGLPDPPRTLAARVILTPLSWLWLAGHRANLRRSLAVRRSLDTKVISIGGLTMGGAGKSPVVAHLAQRLREAGQEPAILTRGYGRKSAAREVIVPRGGSAAVNLTGDEAQMFVRRASAHVGIGGDRFSVGRKMEQELRPGVFLLDDGFQHVRLKRDRDILLLDAHDPLAGGVFPLGRLREPFSSIGRATAVIATRTEPGQDLSGITALVRRYNPAAPLYRSRVVPQEWVDAERGDRYPLSKFAGVPMAAFCGLGAPRSFWRTLRELGIHVVSRWTFGDHHRYTIAELRRLARLAADAGAEALIATEKDAMNLCEGWVEAVSPLRIYWLKIGVEIEGEQELIGRISS